MDAVDELERVTRDVREAFGALSAEALNWKPSPTQWSVAQCLDHLITINRLYFPLLAALADGPVRPTTWERWSPFSGMLGRMLIRSLSPDATRPMKTSPKAEPSSSALPADMVERFAAHQQELAVLLRGIHADVDRRRTIVTSPLLAWVTYSLDDCVRMLVVHEQRHVQQAMRVRAAMPGVG